MTAFPLTSATTLLLMLLMFGTAWNVGHAREKYGIKAPVTTGNAHFERAFRIQSNTIEWMLMFLPTLWILAGYVGDLQAMLIGLAGLAGRVLYAVQYQRDPARRGTGFMTGMLAFAVAGLWSGFAVVRALLAS